MCYSTQVFFECQPHKFWECVYASNCCCVVKSGLEIAKYVHLLALNMWMEACSATDKTLCLVKTALLDDFLD